jgi:hypothetical protein
MTSKSKKFGGSNLTLKTASVFGAAIAALSGFEANELATTLNDDLDSKTIELKSSNKVKPMPVLKLNMENPDNSQFIASHRSHSSHRSHYSHYSHRSGALFS